jgi:hypothetical protein
VEDNLSGYGFDVVTTIEIDKADNPLDSINDLIGDETAIVGTRQPVAGDKVAMLVKGGDVVDFVTIESGNGKLPYETGTQLKVRVEDVVKGISKTGNLAGGDAKADLDQLNEGLKGFLEEKDKAVALIDTLEAQRTNIVSELGTLGQKFEELEARNTEAASLLETSLKALEDAKVEHSAFLSTTRLAQPISAVLATNPEAAELLARSGVLTLGDIKSTPTGDLTRLVRGAGLNGTKLKNFVNIFLDR